MKVYLLYWNVAQDEQVYIGAFSSKEGTLEWMIDMHGFRLSSTHEGGICIWTRDDGEVETEMIEDDLDMSLFWFHDLSPLSNFSDNEQPSR